MVQIMPLVKKICFCTAVTLQLILQSLLLYTCTCDYEINLYRRTFCFVCALFYIQIVTENYVLL